MKGFFFAVCLSLLTLGYSSALKAQSTMTTQPGQSQIQWQTNYNQAVQEAQKSRRPLLLFFTGSDWCGWCKKMQSEVFSSAEFAQSVGGSFVFVEIDFPMNKQLPADQKQQNEQLKQKYGVTGYPTVIILDSNQNFVAEAGYRPGGGKAYADYLKQLLQ
jgi:protein disulfide-isomerase